MATEFRILGTLTVEDQTGPVTIRGARRRALLCRLLVSPNRPVTIDRLAHDIWSEAPPPGAASTLASHVSLLRKCLGPDRLEHEAGGYLIAVGDRELDVSAFEADLAIGQDSLRRHDPQRAADHFGRALALWRGAPLADVGDAGWAQSEVARLDELRLGAEEMVLSARLDLGHHREITAHAEAAVAEQPLREQRWATLMLALYRSGRQADALRSFQRLRALLDEQLGVEPSPELADLEEAIVLQNPELRWRSPGSGRPASPLPPRSDTATPTRSGSGPVGTGLGQAGPVGSSEGTAPAQLPDELRGPAVAFVGRAEEQARLGRLFANATRGQRELVLIGGEPGIGKSSLAAEVARRVDATGGVVLYGRCLEVTNAPYQPFVEALERYVRHAPDAILTDHMAHYGGELARLVPVLARRLPDAAPAATSDAETERYLAFSAATGLFHAIAHERPLLLVIEDLHWADAATLRLLRHLIGHSSQVPLLVLGTFRSDEITPDHALGDTFAALWRDGNVTRIDLEGLSREDVEDLCVSYAGTIIDEDDVPGLAEDLRDETAGNPFFVCEILRAMAEGGPTAQRPAGRWSHQQALIPSELPVSLREVIGQRVRRLGTKTERVLMLASVIGVEFAVPTLSRVADMEPDLLLDPLERADRASLLIGGDGDLFVFAHALIQRTLYRGIQPARRIRLHARVAEALAEGSGGPPVAAVVAHHFLAAGEQESALRWAERAGYDAFESMAPDDAAHWFEQACNLLALLHPDQRLRLCDLTVQQGVGLLLSGRPTYRDVLLRAFALARDVGDGRRMALAALANTRGYYSAAGQIDQDRLHALQDSLALLNAGDLLLRARLTAALCSESAFGTPLEHRRSLAHQAKTTARALDDPRTIVEVNNLVIEAVRYPTELPERLEDTRESLELAERLHDPSALFWAVSHRMRALVEAGRIVEAERHFDRMVEVAAEVGQPVMRWITTFTRAQWAFLRGRTAEGEHLADEAYGIGESIGQPDALNYYATQLSHARWQQGRLHELVELITEGAEQNPGIPGYRGALCRALCQAGDRTGANALLDEATNQHFAHLPQDLLWTYGMVTYAEVTMHLEHSRAAGMLYDLLAPFHDQTSFIGTTCEGPISHYLGGLAAVLGNFDVAEDHFGAAARFAEEAGSDYFCARTLIESGRSSARAGDPGSARRLLTAGWDLADRRQYSAEAERAREALDQLA